MLHSLSGADFALFISVFLACAVEAVEAVTIVLAEEHHEIGNPPFKE